MKVKLLIIFVMLIVCANIVSAQTTEFTYQGKITDTAGTAASYDFEFRLFDVATGGTVLGTLTRLGVPVANGVFTVRLDFGGQFTGANRFLEIAIRPAGSSGGYQQLLPRQPVSSAPYSIRSLNSTTADTSTNSLQLGGVAANQYVITTDTRLSDARNPLPASGNYVQNSTTQQASTNFNIDGNGTIGGNLSVVGTLSLNIVNAQTQYNLGGSRILTASSFSGNVFAGIGAGAANGLGGGNAFFGNGAGQSNVTGGNNSFFGKSAGNLNTASGNSFFGAKSGDGNTTGGSNSFFGQDTGGNNQTGSDNAFFGFRAGFNNATSGNSFFGSQAGDSVTSGASNAFFGRNAGAAVITASGNSFFGFQAGLVNTVADNSFFGAFAGDSNTIGLRNSFFGSSAGSANITGNDNAFLGFNAGFVNTASNNSFFGSKAGDSNTSGASNSFFGSLAGDGNTTGASNSYFGGYAGSFNSTGTDNAFFGTAAGRDNSASFNSIFGSNAGVGNYGGNDNAYFGYDSASWVLAGERSFNSFFGSGAGRKNKDDASRNSFVGYNAGENNSGNDNNFFGNNAGKDNSIGHSNTYLGSGAGQLGTSGCCNTFVGVSASTSHGNGSKNTALGWRAETTAIGSYATAIGAESFAGSNSIKLGRNNGSDTVVIPGNLIVSGSVSKGSGSFRIDHPLDPANKYLYHSFVESPDMMNVYNGNTVTNENGEAEIVLPDYFEALNRDFRYQLTVIGQFAQVIVSAEVKDNRFRIKTDKPAVKVSWQVTGIRKDPFAEKNRIQTEVEKPENERGNYLYPEAYRQKIELTEPQPQTPKP